MSRSGLSGRRLRPIYIPGAASSSSTPSKGESLHSCRRGGMIWPEDEQGGRPKGKEQSGDFPPASDEHLYLTSIRPALCLCTLSPSSFISVCHWFLCSVFSVWGFSLLMGGVGGFFLILQLLPLLATMGGYSLCPGPPHGGPRCVCFFESRPCPRVAECFVFVSCLSWTLLMLTLTWAGPGGWSRSGYPSFPRSSLGTRPILISCSSSLPAQLSLSLSLSLSLGLRVPGLSLGPFPPTSFPFLFLSLSNRLVGNTQKLNVYIT